MASSDEQFSLCWNNFHANMSAGFHGLLSRGDLVDVTLAAEGRILQAHKLVLSVCSPYFQEMFKMNPNQHPIVFLKDVSHSALRDLLQFMYQGEVNVKQEELASFISTAEQLQVKGLTGNQNEESSTPSKPKPTSRPGPRSSQQRISAKLETDLDSKPSLTPVAIKRPNRPSIASNNSSSSQSGPAKRKCVDPLEAGPSGSAKDEFVTIPDEDENNAVAPKMEPEFVNESMWDDDDEGANNDETNFGEDDSNMEMSGFDGSATGDGNISGGGEGGAVGDAQDKYMYRKFFEKVSNNKIICKICSTKMGRGNMVRHFKLKHQLVNRETEKKENSRFDIRKKPSPWAKYCIEVGENQFQCVICDNILNMPKAHGNLKRHIKFKHPKVFEKETKESLKSFWKQFGINSEAEAQKIIKESEEDIEVEEVAIGEAEYLEEYVVDETATVVPSDPENEKNTEEGEPTEEGESREDDSVVKTDLVSKKKYDTNTDESPIVPEVQAVDKIVDFGDLEFVSEDDAKFEEKIKWLADRAVPGKKSFKTRIWNFFKEIKKNLIYECKLCKRNLAGSSRSSSNLKRHLVLVHEKAYEIITNSPNFHKIPKGTIDKLEKYIVKPTDKTFETSYFEDQGDNNYKCKVCDEVIHSDAADSVLLFKHINEEHSEEVVGGIEEPDGDQQEGRSVLFVKKKDLQIS